MTDDGRIWLAGLGVLVVGTWTRGSALRRVAPAAQEPDVRYLDLGVGYGWGAVSRRKPKLLLEAKFKSSKAGPSTLLVCLHKVRSIREFADDTTIEFLDGELIHTPRFMDRIEFERILDKQAGTGSKERLLSVLDAKLEKLGLKG